MKDYIYEYIYLYYIPSFQRTARITKHRYLTVPISMGQKFLLFTLFGL